MVTVHVDISQTNESEKVTFFVLPFVAGAIDSLVVLKMPGVKFNLSDEQTSNGNFIIENGSVFDNESDS